MKINFIKYGKTVKNPNGVLERLEVSSEVGPRDWAEDVLRDAKQFVNKALNQTSEPTFGDALKAKGQQIVSPRPPALPISGPGETRKTPF